jgi:hypothetical protein
LIEVRSDKKEKRMGKKAVLGERKANSQARLADFIDQVKARALEIYFERQNTGKPGDEIGDWVAAENDIKAKYNIA